MADLQAYKTPIYAGVNDTPTAPTANAAGNGSDLLNRVNGLVDAVEGELTALETTPVVKFSGPANLYLGESSAYWVNDLILSNSGQGTFAALALVDLYQKAQGAIGDINTGFFLRRINQSGVQITEKIALQGNQFNFGAGFYSQTREVLSSSGGGNISLNGQESNSFRVILDAASNFTLDWSNFFDGQMATIQFVRQGAGMPTLLPQKWRSNAISLTDDDDSVVVGYFCHGPRLIEAFRGPIFSLSGY